MNVTTINQLVSVGILLERDEAIAALKDPSELQRQLREALGDLAPVTLVHRNGHRKAAPKAKARASTLICPECGDKFKARGLGIHMAKKHSASDVQPASD